MSRQFDIPTSYRSSELTAIKSTSSLSNDERRSFKPIILDYLTVIFSIARHFGFCFGVNNAIEIAHRAIEENPGRKIYLLGEMIHNPEVNDDLLKRGVKFISACCEQDLSMLSADDIVIAPAFGVTLELQERLRRCGVVKSHYDTTCPFVRKVWKRARELGASGFTVIVHGKRTHEETLATFSHSQPAAPTLVIRDLADSKKITDFISGILSKDEFLLHFKPSMSRNFDPDIHLRKIGVVNQTTMLANETKQITAALRQAYCDVFGEDKIDEHFADTRDTLCYATNENQNATKALIEHGADIAIVVGGYNSSNTSHLAELCEQAVPTFYIRDASEILDAYTIRHFDVKNGSIVQSTNWLDYTPPVRIAITSGASCPDYLVENVIKKILRFFEPSTAEQPLSTYIQGSIA
ncbi:MAG: 4-hydroxy-3-methylbut-2-enyl diphosphate reductase [Deltaproteobacteria bacterium]|nr:4-hydroxy-3-methylbut-2-enyl diphosphate reductase [Deltaproteobacteria bacterium]